MNCCERPFPTLNVSTGKNSCKMCGKIWTDKTIFVYNCPNCKQGERKTNKSLNLSKDGRTDWTSCENCHMYVNYKEILFCKEA